MRFTFSVLATFVSFLSFSCFADGFEGLQTSSRLKELVSHSPNHRVYKFVKDLPIFAYKITSSRFNDIPASVKNVLGAVDSTQYTESYLQQNIGSVIAIQVNGDKPDFYVIGKDVFQSRYEQVSFEQVAQKNSKLITKLRATEAAGILDSRDPNLIAVLKKAPVEMLRMSELGYAIGSPATIESPWGEQTKPAGKDAFITFDASKGQYYMINVDEQSLPIGYIPAK
jgi:hypothetical protein